MKDKLWEIPEGAVNGNAEDGFWVEPYKVLTPSEARKLGNLLIQAASE